MSLLITRPRYELVTHYFYHWSEEIVKEAKKRISSVIDLPKEKASRKLVESYLAKQKPEIVIFNGHGNDVCITGNDEEVLIESGTNSHLLKDKVVYMRSCDSGKTLGPQAVKEGCKAFIGYSELFRFWTDKALVNDPLNDDYAKPFFETSNQVALSLIKGKTAKEAHADSMIEYRKVISNLLTSNAANSFVVSDLIWNMHNQVCLEK
jgi:hypothetical protein